MMQELEQTDLDLLRLAITAKCGTQVAFADLLKMSRQNLHGIITKAKKDGGKLKPQFIMKLKKMYGIDIYEWKKNSEEPVVPLYIVEEDEKPLYLNQKLFDHLMDENADLRKRLRKCEEDRENDKKKNKRRSA